MGLLGKPTILGNPHIYNRPIRWSSLRNLDESQDFLTKSKQRKKHQDRSGQA